MDDVFPLWSSKSPIQTWDAHIEWIVNLVVADGYFDIPRGFSVYVWVNMLPTPLHPHPRLGIL